jgi:hypothetical protein
MTMVQVETPTTELWSPTLVLTVSSNSRELVALAQLGQNHSESLRYASWWSAVVATVVFRVRPEKVQVAADKSLSKWHMHLRPRRNLSMCFRTKVAPQQLRTLIQRPLVWPQLMLRLVAREVRATRPVEKLMVVAVVEPQQNQVVDSTLVEQELAQPALDTTVVVRPTRLALEPAAVAVAVRAPLDNLVAAQRVVTVALVAPATSQAPLSTTAAVAEVAEPPQG